MVDAAAIQSPETGLCRRRQRRSDMAEAQRSKDLSRGAAAARFAWDDPFLLDEQLADEERLIRDTARAYAQEKLQPRILEAYREERTDPEIFREMGELGL